MMTPGTYLQKRRVAAGLSIMDLAAMVDTSPRLGGIDKVAWIERIEQDVAALSPDVVVALHDAFRFSPSVLFTLITIRNFGPSALEDAPRLCRICGCSAYDACFDGHATCGWSGPDSCSACVPTAYIPAPAKEA